MTLYRRLYTFKAMDHHDNEEEEDQTTGIISGSVNGKVIPACEFLADRLIIPEGVSFDDWSALGQFLRYAENALQWWIGDWLRYGEERYGEFYAQAMDVTGQSYSTLSKTRWVADRIPPDERRPGLSFSHHKAVAALDKEARKAALDKAEREGLSKGALRQHLAEEGGRIFADCPTCGGNAEVTEIVAPDEVRMMLASYVHYMEIKAEPWEAMAKRLNLQIDDLDRRIARVVLSFSNRYKAI